MMDDISKIELIRDFDPEEGESRSDDRASTLRLNQWLTILLEREGSDLFLVSGVAPSIRVRGETFSIGNEPLSSEEIERAVRPVLASNIFAKYQKERIVDSSYRILGGSRFRINLHHERGNVAATIRALPKKIPILRDLHLPPGVEALSRLPRGLVLLGGPAGSGKTTTLAALVQEINRRDARHFNPQLGPDLKEDADARRQSGIGCVD